MITWIDGGVIGGYWASGSQNSAIAPVRVMTMLSTEAKIGRSMKKCEIMVGAPSALLVLARRRGLLVFAGRRGLWPFPDGGRRRAAGERRHGGLVGLDLQVRPNLLDAA